jgi:hypothetical protein
MLILTGHGEKPWILGWLFPGLVLDSSRWHRMTGSNSGTPDLLWPVPNFTGFFALCQTYFVSFLACLMQCAPIVLDILFLLGLYSSNYSYRRV